MNVFSAIITPQSVAFTGLDGKPYNITSAHLHFDEVKQAIRTIQSLQSSGAPEDEVAEARKTLDGLAAPANLINAKGAGLVSVRDGVVYYGDEPVHNAVTERILWGLKEGFDMSSYIAFLDNLMDNPSRTAVSELYGFIEKHRMGITDDGYIVAYKKVRADYRDIHSGSFDNSPGQILAMPRNKVDDDRNRTCSDGFHFCSFDYLPHFGSGAGDRVVIVKVNPADVVSIPADYNDAKARCCRYEVIGEYEGADLKDLLGERPVWTADAIQNYFGDDLEDEFEEDDYDDEGADDEDGVEIDKDFGETMGRVETETEDTAFRNYPTARG